MRRSTTWAVAAVLTVALPALAGCGASEAEPAAEPSGMHTMADGTVMSDAEMEAMGGTQRPGAEEDAAEGMAGMEPGSQGGPSEAAAMVCSDEIADAVRRNLALDTPPEGTPSWDGEVFTCRYPVGAGTLRLSVRDTTGAAEGRAWFDDLRGRLPRARDIDGMQNFGLPAFETPRGDVGFLKDHKTLWVDATGVRRAALPPGFSRTAVAYGVAAAVVACWSE